MRLGWLTLLGLVFLGENGARCRTRARAPLRPADPRRARHRPQERDRRRPRRGGLGREDRTGRRPRSPPGRPDLVVPAEGLYVVPGLVDIHVHAYAGTGGRSDRRRRQRHPRCAHLPERRHDRRRRRHLGLAHLPRLQAADHRSVADPRPGAREHRGPGHGGPAVRAAHRGHGPGPDRGAGLAVPRGHRRDQDRALRRAGVGRRRAGGRGGDRRPSSR